MNVRREYETTFIVNAALEDADIEAVINKVTNYIENHGGEITAVDRWGRKRLAYSINKKYNGFYVHVVFYANSSTIPILERFLVLEDTVLRHLTLVYPKKLKDYREKKAIEILKRQEEAANEDGESNTRNEKVIEVKNKIDFDEVIVPKVVINEEEIEEEEVV
jgi:small subunit ribosomal protein S6